ncbi:MAG: hypothetical protein VW362_07815, partial [Candidatus Nanopelagicales bacterium]
SKRGQLPGRISDKIGFLYAGDWAPTHPLASPRGAFRVAGQAGLKVCLPRRVTKDFDDYVRREGRRHTGY